MSIRIDFEKEKFEDLKFPDNCHACSKAYPSSKVHLNPRAGNNQPLNEDMSKGWPMDIPTCKGCEKKIWLSRWISSGLTFITVIVVIILLLITSEIFPDMGTWGYVAAILIYMVIGITIQNALYSPPFDVQPDGHLLSFYYKDIKLGEEFARLNEIDTVYDDLNQDRKLTPPSSLDDEPEENVEDRDIEK